MDLESTTYDPIGALHVLEGLEEEGPRGELPEAEGPIIMRPWWMF